MVTAGIVMPLVAEKTNVLQAPSVASDKQRISFAKSFGDIAANVGELEGGVPAAPVSGKKALLPFDKDRDGKAGWMGAALNVSADERPKGMETAITKNAVADGLSIPTKSLEKTTSSVPFVLDDVGSEVQELPPRMDQIDVSNTAVSGGVGKPVEPMEDAIGEKMATETKIVSMEEPAASKIVQLPLLSDAEIGRAHV